MNFFKKLFGLNDEKPVNLLQKKKRTYILDAPVNLEDQIKPEMVMPFIVSTKTTEFDLNGISAPVFYEREGIYGQIFETYAHLDYSKLDENGDPSISQIRTENTELIENVLTKNAEINIEKLEIDFIYWHPSDAKCKIDILSVPISFFASELIMSKKHMNKAHKMLGSNKLFVSIPRRGLIFICDYHTKEKDLERFVKLHSSIILNNNTDLDILCEDIFIVENSEMYMVQKMPELSDLLRKKINIT